MECCDYGWFAKRHPFGPGYISCEPHEPGAETDLNRLRVEADWDRQEKRYVRTNLTAAFGEMGRRGVPGSRGWHGSRSEEVAEMLNEWKRALARGEKVLGCAFYTMKGKSKMQQGKNFSLFYGQIKHPTLAPIGLPDARVRKIVCDCLDEQEVKYRLDSNLEHPIRVVTASISAVG